jgi:4-amino-4-deoxy-L-arabinose transferase-like glycosyltransferase
MKWKKAVDIFYGEKLWKAVIWIVLGIGVCLRLKLYLDNHNLIIDEANIVRNLAERSFRQLTTPLRYEQYAPPVFLWVEKLFSLFFGYGEKALRLYPLLCGISSMFLFYFLLKRFLSARSLWLPVALFALTYLLTKYSVELKQYMSDTMIGLLLILFALKIDILKTGRIKFLAAWFVIGSIAIWASMPSVFFLAAVGSYYAWICLKAKDWKALGLIALVAVMWLAEFGAYYFFILKPQIESDYLQNYHADYFLFATPSTPEEWQHNWVRIKEIINNTGGYSLYSTWITITLIAIGGIYLLIKRFPLFILFGVPVALTFLAAMLNQFSLIDRVIMFLYPLLLVFFAFGFHQLCRIGFLPLQLLLVCMGALMLIHFNQFKIFVQKYGFHEITLGMDYVLEKKGQGKDLFVHDASAPTYIYYTELHPDREKYNSLLNAHRMKWDSDYTIETAGTTDTVWFLYTGGFPEPEREKRKVQIEQNLKQVDYFEKYICFVFGYAPKQQND